MDPVIGTVVVAAIAAIAQIVVALVNHNARTAGKQHRTPQGERRSASKAPLIAAYVSTAAVVVAVLIQLLL